MGEGQSLQLILRIRWLPWWLLETVADDTLKHGLDKRILREEVRRMAGSRFQEQTKAWPM